MLSAERFNDFLTDLQMIDRMPARNEAMLREHGKQILDSFVRHTGSNGGAIYLSADHEQAFVLMANTSNLTAPRLYDGPIPDDVTDQAASNARAFPFHFFEPNAHTLVPLRQSRENIGLIALTRPHDGSESNLDLLRAASSYAAAILRNQQMETEVKEGEFQLKYRLWELESLYDIGLSIASTLNLDELSEQILIRTLSLLNARSAALFLRDGKRFVLHRAFGDVRSQFLDEEVTEEQLCGIVDTGCPIQMDKDANCIFPGCETFVALPIRGNEGTIGVLAVADRELREGGVAPFEANDVRLLSQFATQAAIALENARLHREALEKQAMDRELEVAATIQKEILPRSLPVVEGYEVAALARPARLVGGDYYTFFETEGVLSFCLADVAGKSVPAAILVSALHAALQLLWDEGRPIDEIASELNRHIHRWSSENKFITLFLASVDREAGVLRFVNAGHNPGYVVNAGAVEELHSHGLPIGLMANSRYSTQTVPFPAGSLLAVYSDGISEAENAADDEFGSDRLQEILVANEKSSCIEVISRVAAAVTDFAGDLAQKDDQTMVVVRTT
jgi:phosphoserine phosphatase RsbU/P